MPYHAAEGYCRSCVRSQCSESHLPDICSTCADSLEMFGVCLGYVGHYQGPARRSQFRRLGRHSSNPGLPVNNSSELSKIKDQLPIRISSCIVFCWFLLSWLMSHGGETLKQNCGYSCYVVQAVHTSIHLTRHWHCFELTGNSEVHHARDARLIKIDRDWSRLWSWYSTVCFASALFSLALSGRETSTTPQKSWKARGLEGCPEIKSFPGRTHRNWFLHIFLVNWVVFQCISYIYSDYTRIFIFVLSVTPISACVYRGSIPVKLMSFSQMISTGILLLPNKSPSFWNKLRNCYCVTNLRTCYFYLLFLSGRDLPNCDPSGHPYTRPDHKKRADKLCEKWVKTRRTSDAHNRRPLSLVSLC